MTYTEKYEGLSRIIEKYPFPNYNVEEILNYCENEDEEKNILEQYYRGFIAHQNQL